MPRIKIDGKTYTEQDFGDGAQTVTSTDEAGNTTTITAGANSVVTRGDLHVTSIEMD